MRKKVYNDSVINDFGYFWFPDKPEEKIPGKIIREKFNQSFLIHLLMQQTGFWFLYNIGDCFEIVCGELSSIGAVTLKSLRVISSSNDGNYCLEAEFLFTNICLEGRDFDNYLENFKTKVFLNGLSNWKFHNIKDIILEENQQPVIKLFNQDSQLYCVQYKGCEINLGIVFGFNLHDKSISDLDIRDYSYIEFQFGKINFNDLIGFFRGFADLLTVLWGFPAIIKNIEFTDIETNYICNLLMRQYILKENFLVKKNEDSYHVRLKDIEDGFELIVNKWFELKNSHQMAIDILMEQYYRPFVSPNNDFLALCRAIESYGKSICEKSEEYHNRNIRKKSKGRRSVLLKDVLGFIEKYISEKIAGLIGFDDKKIKTIVECRNELTHEKLPEKEDIFKLYLLMKLVFLSVLLKEFDICDDLIERAIDKTFFVPYINKK
ncbi:MAG: hypothetical protein PHF36_04295 [Candidatus Cloacimonetes bacterium]|nr:hypothetical protein [Candidatus Cloacimonadota bacterium]